MEKDLTRADILDKFCLMLRERATEIGFGSLEMECTFEVHDGQIRTIEHSEKKRRTKMRTD